MRKVLCVIGTRPEAIKMAPVLQELTQRADAVATRTCVTAQHREMLDQVLGLFRIQPDHDLDVMVDRQTPTQVAAAVLRGLEAILAQERPDWVLVQGDTTTAAAAALAAFYAGSEVGHVEAGLRTHDKWQPFPEELNRRVVGAVADMHFAPTNSAGQNLLREGVPGGHIVVTGNPVIDALHWVVRQPYDLATLGIPGIAAIPDGRRLILVTAHRRENLGQPLNDICLALRDIAARYNGEAHIVYPVHRNPRVWEPVHRLLSGVPHITLTPPLDYLPLVHLMKQAHLVLTDSGGLQEEAPSLGKPVLVMREVTERPEAVEAGTVLLVGTDRERIVSEASRLLDDEQAYARMARALNPYGDGHAAQRIVAALMNSTGRRPG